MVARSGRTLAGCCWGRRTGHLGLVERFAGRFMDRRRPELIEHEVRTLIGQRMFGLALG